MRHRHPCRPPDKGGGAKRRGVSVFTKSETPLLAALASPLVRGAANLQAMSVVKAEYFDGKTSLKHAVSVVFSGTKLKIIGAAVNLEFDARRVRRSIRVANTPRWLYLPGGGALVTADNAAIDRLTRKGSYERFLERWEAAPTYAALALAYRALAAGGTAPALLNGANEVAVEAFLAGRLAFTAIHEVIESTLTACLRDVLPSKYSAFTTLIADPLPTP